jgi:hypothetical protein
LNKLKAININPLIGANKNTVEANYDIDDGYIRSDAPSLFDRLNKPKNKSV